jgi:cell division inhibitor SepF
MGAMYRLKAYFGMVPAEELTEYEDEPVERVERYVAARRARAAEDGRADDRWADRGWDDQRWSGPSGAAPVGASLGSSATSSAGSSSGSSTGRGRGERTWEDDSWEDGRYADGGPAEEDTRADESRRSDEWSPRRAPARAAVAERRRPLVGPPTGGLSGGASGPVRGALAIDTAVAGPLERAAISEPVRPVAPVAAVSGAAAAPEQRDRVATLARITTLSPQSYKEARTIGERYRDGQPVIMNLTELDAADAKRLVDFAAGLAFALRGGFDKIATRVFLLTPADVEVSADDARKLAERGLFRQD